MKILALILLTVCLFVFLNDFGLVNAKRLHFKKFPNRKTAEDAARDAGKGIKS
jgi:hypothetical protein